MKCPEKANLKGHKLAARTQGSKDGGPADRYKASGGDGNTLELEHGDD